MDELGEEEREIYEKVSKTAFDVLKRVDATMSKSIIPSLKDGQSALVFGCQV